MTKVPHDLSLGDPDIASLMEENFGPPDGAGMERGMQIVTEMADANATPGQCRWLYESVGAHSTDQPTSGTLCFGCGSAAPTSRCAKCGVALYCSRACQVAHWKGGHKHDCGRYKLLGRQMAVPPSATHEVVEAMLARIRLYANPFAVCHAERLGCRGLVLLQSERTLAELALPAPVDCCGRPLPAPRSLLLQFLPAEEFADLSAAGGPLVPLAEARGAVASAVAACGADEVVVLCALGCMSVLLLAQPLVPDLRVCRALASDYVDKEMLQLDMDDM